MKFFVALFFSFALLRPLGGEELRTEAEEVLESFLAARQRGEVEKTVAYFHPDSLRHFRDLLTALHGRIAEKLKEPEALYEITGFETILPPDQLADTQFFRLCVERLDEEDRVDDDDWQLVALGEGRDGRLHGTVEATTDFFGVRSRVTRSWALEMHQGKPLLVTVFYSDAVARQWLGNLRRIEMENEKG